MQKLTLKRTTIRHLTATDTGGSESPTDSLTTLPAARRFAPAVLALALIAMLIGACSLDARIASKEQKVCTQEDIDNGTCPDPGGGGNGGGWTQISPSDPAAISTSSALHDYVQPDPVARSKAAECAMKGDMSVTCCVTLHRTNNDPHNSPGFCCTAFSNGAAAQCYTTADTDCDLYNYCVVPAP